MIYSSALLVLLVVALTVGTARENRNWADDYSLWSQAARIRPDFWPGHYNAGLEMMEAKRFDEADKWLQRAANLAPNEPAIFDALGRNYAEMGDTRSAKASFNRAIEVDPTMFESLNSLGQIHFKEKKYAEAEMMFNAALRLKPQAFAPRFNLGLCFAEQGKFEDAVRHFEQAAAISRDDAEAWYQLALAYEKTNRAGDAISALERGSAFARSPELAQKMSEATTRLRSK
jgi:tetratricopeptide (TPR) repeat protein